MAQGIESRLKKLVTKKCEKCSFEGKTNIHHLDSNLQNNDIYNLQRLCNKCHRQTMIFHLTQNCRMCKKKFKIKSSNQKFCSEGCRRKYREIIESGTEIEFQHLFKERSKSK